jgi:amino acid transporter
VLSYRQTIAAYPSGGGSYIVASDNLGETAGLTAAASLLIDYVLTVSVSIAAGVAAITSLYPEALPYALEISIGAVILITVANLRGIRESGTIFAAPTYVFVVTMYGLIGYGLYRLAVGDLVYQPPEAVMESRGQAVGIFFLMSAFAQGCTAMTGTEAISNGVPAFKQPEAKNARSTLVLMGLLLGSMFVGM